MSPLVFRRTLLYSCWLPFVGALLAVSIQALRIPGKPVRYIAVGKIMAGIHVKSESNGTEPYATFYGTQIEILQSGQLRASAADRVHVLQPELRECNVDIIVTRRKDSAVINVAAIGAERQYTRSFLDALLDEYLAMRKKMSDESVYGVVNKVIEQVLLREKRTQAAKAKLDVFLKENGGAEFLTAERSRLSRLVSELRGDMEALQAAATSGDQAPSTKLQVLETRLKDAEASFKQVLETAAKVDSLKDSYEREYQAYTVWKNKLEQLSTAGLFSGEPAAIMERPADAFAEPPDHWSSLITAAVLGFAGGVVLMIIVAVIAALRAPSPPPLKR